MADSPLEKTASIGAVRKLFRNGLMSDEAFAAATRVLQPPSAWLAWARRMLLIFGSALVLAGIIYFFAYNWSGMDRFLKFGILEGGILVAVLASHLLGMTRLSSKILLLSASVLVGVLLGVYGQTYQTGADAYELFLAWAALILGWVIVSDFAALWIVWLILLNISAALYWEQVGSPCGSVRYEFLCLAAALVNGLALALRETGARRGLPWLRDTWLRCTLLAATLTALSLPTLFLIVESGSAAGVSALSPCVWAAAAVGGYLCYRWKLPDMVSLAIIVMNGCVILLTFIQNMLFHGNWYEEAAPLLVLALLILVVVSAAAFWLKKTADKMAAGEKEASP